MYKRAYKAANHNKTDKRIVEMLDLQADFGEPMARLTRLVRSPKFFDSLEMQKNATKIIRGMAVKFKALKLAEKLDDNDADALWDAIMQVAGEYEGLFREQLVKLQAEGTFNVNVISYKQGDNG